MMSRYAMYSSLVCILILMIGCNNGSSSTEKEIPVKNTNAFEQNQKLAKSVNLGNALEAPSEGEWGVVLQAEYFQLIHEAGFTGVRIPVRWSAHAMDTAPYTINRDIKDRVDWAIHQARANDLAVLINIHHYNELMAEPENHKERFLALLSQLAEHFKDEPDDLLFEILNEPHENLTPELWNSYLSEAIAAYRSVDPQRTLVIGTAEWGGIGSLHKLVLPDTVDNLIVTVHYYNPFHFTHQGAEWVSGSDEWLGTTWRGYPSELTPLEEDFDQVASWAAEHNRPVFVGEFGAYNKADMTSRAAWTKAVRREAEERGMSWSYWEFCAGFGIYNTGDNSWNTELLNALIPQ